MKVFRRKTDNGHASVFKSRVAGNVIVVEIKNNYTGDTAETSLSKEDAKRYAEWLLKKCGG